MRQTKSNRNSRLRVIIEGIEKMRAFSFVIFKDGTNCQAKNTSTGAIQFTNSNATVVINSVISVYVYIGGWHSLYP